MISGCTTEDLEGDINQTYDEDYKADQSSDALEQAFALYNRTHTDLETFNSKLSEMRSKGVDTTKTEQTHTSATNEFDNATNLLYSANSAHQYKNYDTALSYANQAISQFQSVQNTFSQLSESLKQDYQRTVNVYKIELKDTEKQYIEAKFYVDEIRKVGVDVSSTRTKLQSAFDTLSSAKDSFQQGQFSGLGSQLSNIKSTANEIKDKVTDLYFNSITKNKIEEAQPLVETSKAKTLLESAEKKRLEKRYQEAIADVNKAFFTEIHVDIDVNMEKVRDFAKSNNLEISLVTLEACLEDAQKMINFGQFEQASQSMTSVKDSLSSYNEAIAKVVDSKKVVEDTGKLSFCWIESADLDKTNFQKAKLLLEEGNTIDAITYADAAIEEAKNEQQKFWREVKKDWVCGFLLSMAKLFGNPEEFKIIPVERPALQYKDAQKLAVVDFSKPPVDISNIDIAEPQPPSFDEYQPPAPQIPDEPTPTIPADLELETSGSLTECGTTCRNTTAKIINKGGEIARNVYVKLTVKCSGSTVNFMDGQPFREEYIGDLAGGKYVQRVVKLETDYPSAILCKMSGEAEACVTISYDDRKTKKIPCKSYPL